MAHCLFFLCKGQDWEPEIPDLLLWRCLHGILLASGLHNHSFWDKSTGVHGICMYQIHKTVGGGGGGIGPKPIKLKRRMDISQAKD